MPGFRPRCLPLRCSFSTLAVYIGLSLSLAWETWRSTHLGDRAAVFGVVGPSSGTIPMARGSFCCKKYEETPKPFFERVQLTCSIAAGCHCVCWGSYWVPHVRRWAMRGGTTTTMRFAGFNVCDSPPKHIYHILSNI